MRYDTAVIGCGPAGLEAALNLKIRKKNFILFGNTDLSRKVSLAPRIDNYLGLPGISGKDLAQAFLRHLDQMEITVTHQQVSTIFPMKDYFALATGENAYEASTVILATGAVQTDLIPGEEAFLGRGVGYCATCDAPLYKGKRVAVVGYSDHAVQEANFISNIAAATWYLPMRKTESAPENTVEVIQDSILEITGTDHVSSLVLKNGTLEVDGVFVLRESIAPSSLIPGIETLNGYIKTDAQMQTSIPGCFAAGDCTGMPHQYMRAAGQGQTAALSAVDHLDRPT